ncbi:uncharacterized protein LOC141672190 isoform X1 [Apium graveolens]|uniref:uncharacterized protein LOC141672190 isoform X1 n=2 Tax=Apium graveolens TaxID=4045 RepID=UPI003D7B4779
MGSKKIIAICQSGGEFKTGDDGSLVYDGGEAYAVDVDHETRWDNFKQELAEMFQYSIDDFLIKYFLPGHRKTLISISREKDLQRMVNFCEDFDQVEVFVINDSGVALSVPNVSGSRPSKISISEAAVLPDTPLLTAKADDTIDIEMDTANQSNPDKTLSLTNDENNHMVAMQWQNTITGVNQRFSSFPEFRDALHKYSIAHGFTYKFKKNDSQRVSVVCKAEGCQWRIWASKVASTQLICIKKMIGIHTCEGTKLKAEHRAGRGWVGSIIKEKLKLSPNYKPRDIVADIEREYGVQLNYSQAWRAKGLAREQLHGSHKEAYSQLPFLCNKIIETNPGSIAKFTTKEDSSFHRLFVSFHASISGFERGCRPLIFLDSTPLNSKYQGVLLTATAADGDDGIFPVAFAIVDDETDDNWHYFILELRSVVSTSHQITFIADFQKGLKETLREIFGGGCYHGYCLHYLAEKLNIDLKEPFSYEARRLMVQDLYAAATAPKLDAFERCTESLKAISPEAYNWVISSEPDHWANAFFAGSRYNHVSSNFGLPFYGWLSDANELPITQIIDSLRGKMMDLYYKRRADSSHWETRLTPSMEEKLKSATLKAHLLQVSLLDAGTFEVQSESVDIVNVDHWDCSCKGWQITGLPCCHAIAVILGLGRDPYDYCSRYFTAESYRLTYLDSISPVPNVDKPVMIESQEVEILVTPPPTRCPASRKKRKHGGSSDIIKRTLQCSKCKGLGHNKKTCSVAQEDNNEASEPLPLSIDVTIEEELTESFAV